MIEVRNGVGSLGVREVVLYPFDDASIPFSDGLRLHLVSGKSGKSPIVLARGEPGEPDDEEVRFYGTVIQIGDELRMWYHARGSLDPKVAPHAQRFGGREYTVPGMAGPRRLCYAVSRDGVNWEKPKLGLVEYNGSKENNIVDILGGECSLCVTPILHDPDDPDPSRRFKTAFESDKYGGGDMAVAYSPDGLHWTESPHNPVGLPFEQAGLVKFNGCYYVSGQWSALHFGQARKMNTFASYDFEHWTLASCLSFRRDSLPPRQMATHLNAGEQVHLGAGLWNRGNVILGVYGMWHGDVTEDLCRVAMDLGLVVSNDALHYREPIPDFRLIPAFGELGATPGVGPSLMQGQGMCNIGDRTLFWYGLWREDDVRLASWARDRLGYFEVYPAAPTRQQLPRLPHCLSCPLQLDDGGGRVYANVDGISEHSTLTVELCDEQFRPLPGYSGEDSIPLAASGLRQPVVWRGREVVRGLAGPLRLRATFGGLRPEDVKLYALYVTPAG